MISYRFYILNFTGIIIIIIINNNNNNNNNNHNNTGKITSITS